MKQKNGTYTYYYGDKRNPAAQAVFLELDNDEVPRKLAAELRIIPACRWEDRCSIIRGML